MQNRTKEMSISVDVLRAAVQYDAAIAWRKAKEAEFGYHENHGVKR